MPNDVEAIAEQVFADPTRRAILAALASGGPATATHLAVDLPITRQAIGEHLACWQKPPRATNPRTPADQGGDDEGQAANAGAARARTRCWDNKKDRKRR